MPEIMNNFRYFRFLFTVGRIEILFEKFLKEITVIFEFRFG